MFFTILNIYSQHDSLIHNIGLFRVKENSRIFPPTGEGLSIDDVVEFMDGGLASLDQRLDSAASLEVETSVVGVRVAFTAVDRGVDVDDGVRWSDVGLDVDDRSCSY